MTEPTKILFVCRGNVGRSQMAEEMFDKADKVVLIVDDADPIPDYVVGSDKVIRWNVPDPKGATLERHRAGMNQIKELVLSTSF